jgi:ribonuclease P protein component
MPGFNFKPPQRLLTKVEFDRVYKEGRRVADSNLNLHAVKNNAQPRLGMSVSTKNAGSSVRRNQIRRWIREDFRLRQNTLLAADYVVTVKAPIRERTHTELAQVLTRVYALMSQRLEGQA